MKSVYVVSLLSLILSVSLATYAVNRKQLAANKVQDPYSNDNIHAWACDTVFKSKPDDKSGCYDICWTLGGGKRLRNGQFTDAHMVSDEYSSELQNACAIVLNGAAW